MEDLSQAKGVEHQRQCTLTWQQPACAQDAALEKLPAGKGRQKAQLVGRWNASVPCLIVINAWKAYKS